MKMKTGPNPRKGKCFFKKTEDEIFFHCDHCSFKTLYEHQLDIHVKWKHPLKSNLKRKSEKSSDQIATKKANFIPDRTNGTTASFTCDICGHKASNNWNLSRHTKIHQGWSVYLFFFPITKWSRNWNMNKNIYLCHAVFCKRRHWHFDDANLFI